MYLIKKYEKSRKLCFWQFHKKDGLRDNRAINENDNHYQKCFPNRQKSIDNPRKSCLNCCIRKKKEVCNYGLW